MAINVKITTFVGVMDLVMPHSCRGCGAIGKPLCDCCKNDILKMRRGNFCPNCGHEFGVVGRRVKNEKSFLKYRPNKYLPRECPYCHLPLCYVVGERVGVLANLIHDYKYDSVRALGQPLAELLHGVLPRLPRDTVIVPLPTVAKHVRMRGLDHTEVLAKRLARLRGYRVERLLLRAKNTVQVGTSRKLRIKQAAGAYAVDPEMKVDPEKTYLLIDDVWTTGASVKAAIEVLRKAGAQKIVVGLLAVSED